MAKAKAKPKTKKGAAKKSAAKPAATSKKKDTPQGSIRLTPKNALEALAEKCFKIQNTVSEASGGMGKAISECADKHNLHKGAFSIAKRLYNMGKKDPGKLWLLLCHLDDHRKKLDLDGIADQQGQLVDSGVEAEEPAEEAAVAEELSPPVASEGGEVVDLRPRHLREGGGAREGAQTDLKTAEAAGKA